MCPWPCAEQAIYRECQTNFFFFRFWVELNFIVFYFKDIWIQAIDQCVLHYSLYIALDFLELWGVRLWFVNFLNLNLFNCSGLLFFIGWFQVFSYTIEFTRLNRSVNKCKKCFHLMIVLQLNVSKRIMKEEKSVTNQGQMYKQLSYHPSIEFV